MYDLAVLSKEYIKTNKRSGSSLFYLAGAGSVLNDVRISNHGYHFS